MCQKLNRPEFSPGFSKAEKITSKKTIEYYLAKYTILLPIDQRYSLDDIDKISYVVRSLILQK